MLSTNYFGTLPREMLFAKTETEKAKLYPQILHASNGKYTNGVYTSLKQILNIIQDYKPEGVAVVLDCTRDTFRREIYSDYKATRSNTPPPLKEQFDTFSRVLTAIGIPVFSSNEHEADDLAGAIAKNLESNGKKCILISGDKDYYQLVSQNTSLWRIVPTTAKKKYEQVYGFKFTDYYSTQSVPQGLFEIKFADKIMIENVLVDLTPEQFIDYLAVAGDKADNIPGVYGIGTMTIIPLLQRYGSLDGIYDVIQNSADTKQLAEQWKSELGIKKNPINAFIKDKDNAYLSRKLATIKTDIEFLPTDASAYNLSLNITGLAQVIQEYEFSSLKSYL